MISQTRFHPLPPPLSLFVLSLSLTLLLPIIQAAPTLTTVRQIPDCPEICFANRTGARRDCRKPELKPFCRLGRCPFSETVEGFRCTRRNVLPSATPTGQPASASASASATPSLTPSISESSSASPVPTQSSSNSPIPTESSSVTPSATPSISESSSATPSVTASVSISSTPSPNPSDSSSSSPVPSESSSSSPIPSESSSVTPTMSPSASPSVSPPPPRFAGALICSSGRSVFNVGVVDVDGELNIAIFSVTEETALEYLDCIQNDRSTRSVEEYLNHAFDNCIGEDPDTCVVNDLATGNCTCTGNKPVRCIWPPYKRSVQRCDDA